MVIYITTLGNQLHQNIPSYNNASGFELINMVLYIKQKCFINETRPIWLTVINLLILEVGLSSIDLDLPPQIPAFEIKTSIPLNMEILLGKLAILSSLETSSLTIIVLGCFLDYSGNSVDLSGFLAEEVTKSLKLKGYCLTKETSIPLYPPEIK